MIRWVALFVVLAAVLATAIGIIVLRHESRQQFAALQKAEMQRDAARVEWSRLQLEQAWLGDAGRIEREAVEKLDMRPPVSPSLMVRKP